MTPSLLLTFYQRMLARPGLLLASVLVLSLPMAQWSVRLFQDVRADLRQLLPENAPSVLALHELERRFGGWTQLSIVIESPDRTANRRFSEDMVRELKQLPAVRSVRNKLGEEKTFFEERWPLFLSVETLEKIEERIEGAKVAARLAANPLYVDLGERPPVDLDLSDLIGRRDWLERHPNGWFESPDGNTLAIDVRRRGTCFSLADNQKLVADVEAIVRRLDPASYHTELKVGLGGDVKNVLEEHASLIDDLFFATVVVLLLVALSVIIFYRSLRALYLLGVPVLIASLWTFGISYLVIGHLNASSAFLAAIVPGNGINFGIIMLARYAEERRGGSPKEGAVARAIGYTARATAVASLAAAVAYGSLIVTDFRGFLHFGIIGGLGMVLSWIASFTVLPALILLSRERKLPRNGSDEAIAPLSTRSALRLPIGSSNLNLPMAIVPRLFNAIFLLTGIAGLLATAALLRDPFERNFRELQSTSSKESGSAHWEAKADAIFGRNMNPQVILAERAEDVPQIVASLERNVGERAPLSEVLSLAKLVPSNQAEKIAVAERIRAMLSDELIASLDEDDRRLAEKVRPSADLRPFAASDLPASLRADFLELDGTEGRVVLVLPNVALNLYDAREIVRVADAMREIRLDDGRVIRSSGNYVIYADMLQAVGRDGPTATAFSFFGVLLLAAVVFRKPRQVAAVSGALLLGVSWLGAAMYFLDIRINFLNFIALPITFGIGADYAVNVFSRYLSERRERDRAGAAKAAVSATGGAVVLCSATTIIGYGSLLFAGNGALQSFGIVAIVGEIACLVAAVVALPVYLISRQPRSR